MKSVHQNLAVWLILIVLLFGISACEGISCFECSSVDDNYCPDTMSSDDEGIVPYNDCSSLFEAQNCVKTTGVTGGSGSYSDDVTCYVCDETNNSDFGCSDPTFFATYLKSCRDVFDAQYCIKTTGIFGGSLGTRRFCSSRDMGNYCEYIKRPGDQLEYRSCVFTCSGNGCNAATSTIFISFSSIYIVLTTSVLSFMFSHWNSYFHFIAHLNPHERRR